MVSVELPNVKNKDSDFKQIQHTSTAFTYADIKFTYFTITADVVKF